ncbi:MAG: glycosyltransferase [Patescibacteria group bacterium]|nr:glycosyltransferase [Patescibacteria group bacterium]
MNSQLHLHILMLAYYFPPDASSGAFRPLYFANHLVEQGIEVTVITVKERDFLSLQPKDLDLLDRVDPRVRVNRTGLKRPREALIRLRNRLQSRSSETVNFSCFEKKHDLSQKEALIQRVKDTITDILASPDPHVGWIPATVRKGVKLVHRNNINVLYATGSPWSSFLAAVAIGELTSVPIVLDFRDPWISNPSFLVRGKIVRNFEKRMEHIVLRKAAAVIANTEELQGSFLERYPFLSTKQVHTIPNGFESFLTSTKKRMKKMVITHVGALYFSRNPVQLLKALANLLRQGVISENEIEVVFVGGIAIEDPSLATVLASPCLRRTVRIIPRVSYDEALKYQISSDILLLIQPGFPLQIPRKLYEYMAIMRPILALTDTFGATAQIIQKYKLGEIVPNEITKIEQVLRKLYEAWRTDGLVLPSKENLENFLNAKLTVKLVDVFEKLNSI